MARFRSAAMTVDEARNSRRDWPERPWLLTAPESYVLNYAGDGHGHEALKLAVKELVSRRALGVVAVQTRGPTGRRKLRTALVEGPVQLDYALPLTPVFDLFTNTRKRRLDAAPRSGEASSVDGVLISDFAKAARKRFRPLTKYRDGCVTPALKGRGLLTTRSQGMFGRQVPTWTPAGHDALNELEEWLRIGHRRFNFWLHANPERALAYTVGAGALILLREDMYPAFAALGRKLAAGGLAEATVVGLASDPTLGPAIDALTGPDPCLGPLDLAALDASFSDLGGMDAALAAISVGIDAGGAGGGGGGGDGGGGG
jgi:hypothetical protein